MPLSVWTGMEATLEAIVARRPRSVLDAGIGFGLWGHLLRQYLDVWEGRVTRAEWRVRIDGIEIDEARILPHARYLYDEVAVGDIRVLVPACAAAHSYDVILFGDVLEHLPKADAVLLLRQAVALAGNAVVVRIPLDDGWRREGRHPPDDHRSTWAAADFDDFGDAVHQHQFHYCGLPYGQVVIEAPAWRQQLLRRADVRLAVIEAQAARMSGIGRPT